MTLTLKKFSFWVVALILYYAFIILSNPEALEALKFADYRYLGESPALERESYVLLVFFGINVFALFNPSLNNKTLWFGLLFGALASEAVSYISFYNVELVFKIRHIVVTSYFLLFVITVISFFKFKKYKTGLIGGLCVFFIVNVIYMLFFHFLTSNAKYNTIDEVLDLKSDLYASVTKYAGSDLENWCNEYNQKTISVIFFKPKTKNQMICEYGKLEGNLSSNIKEYGGIKSIFEHAKTKEGKRSNEIFSSWESSKENNQHKVKIYFYSDKTSYSIVIDQVEFDEYELRSTVIMDFFFVLFSFVWGVGMLFIVLFHQRKIHHKKQ